MKRIITLLVAITILGTAGLACAETVRISISQFVEHPALDAVLKGFQDDLKEHGVDVEYKEYNAHANMGTANQIATQIIADEPDMVLAIATPTAQACARIYDKAPHFAKIPMVFTAITDPVAAGLVSNYEKPEAMITGVSNRLPMDKHVDMVKRFIPDVKSIGVMYNAGEVNSVVNVERFKKAAAERGIEVVDAPVTTSADVYQAAHSLVGNADAVYVPTDNTVISALEAVIKVCEKAQLPLFTADTDSVKRGSIAAMGFDYYEHGKQTGALARRILNGQKPTDTPVEFQKNLSFHINPAAAARMGLKVDKSIIDSADVLY